MNAPKLKLVSETREQRIERALRALTDCMADTEIDIEVRQKLAEAHQELHACRSPETVRQMEQQQGLTK
jgi:uncharacterized protein (UPF0147 family)